MQIVIDKESLTTVFTVAFYAICGEDYSDVKNTVIELLDKVGYTPLPKGHGRLIDELDLDLFAPSLGTDEHVNDLMAKHNIDYGNGDDEDKVREFALDLIHSCMNVIETSPTIIEADRAEKEESHGRTN